MNVKPGDMAYIVKPCLAAGTIVEVLKQTPWCEMPRSLLVLRMPTWDVKIANGTVLNDPHTYKPSYGLPGTIVMVADAWLRPINPETDPEAVPAPAPSEALTS